MPIDEIAQRVSERYAEAAATGEQLCCPSGYDFSSRRSFIPDDVRKISYDCRTPAGLATVQPGKTVLDLGAGGGIDCLEAGRLKQMIDERGRTFARGIPRAINETIASAPRTAPFGSCFLLSGEPLSVVPPDPRSTVTVPAPPSPGAQ